MFEPSLTVGILPRVATQWPPLDGIRGDLVKLTYRSEGRPRECRPYKGGSWKQY